MLKMKRNNFILQIFIIMLISQKIQPLEQVFRPCPRNSPKIADCVKQAIEILAPQIRSGVFGPTLVVDDHLDLLKIGDVSVNRNLNLKLNNLQLKGLDNFKIKKLRVNPENFKVEMIVFFPHVDGAAKYNLKWNLGILSIQGNGDNSVTLDNVTAHIKLAGTKYLKNNGPEYLKINSTQLVIKSAQLRSYFDNLFNGQKALERTANDIINQNIDILKGDVFPTVEEQVGKILFKISNQIFASAPFDKFFPLK